MSHLSLSDLEQQRSELLRQILELGDLRPGSISGTGGRCGTRGCHCHQEGDPGHAPHPRLTYKLGGKTVSESFAVPAARRKAEREISEFRRFQDLCRDFVDLNTKICRARPVEETLTPQEKKRPKRSSKRSSKKYRACSKSSSGAGGRAAGWTWRRSSWPCAQRCIAAAPKPWAGCCPTMANIGLG